MIMLIIIIIIITTIFKNELFQNIYNNKDIINMIDNQETSEFKRKSLFVVLFLDITFISFMKVYYILKQILLNKKKLKKV